MSSGLACGSAPGGAAARVGSAPATAAAPAATNRSRREGACGIGYSVGLSFLGPRPSGPLSLHGTVGFGATPSVAEVGSSGRDGRGPREEKPRTDLTGATRR